MERHPVKHPDRILREPEVGEKTGLSRTTRWRLTKKNKFPAPVRLSDTAIGWRASDIEAWIASRQPTREAA
jgi:prophage regulatory protein